MKRLCYLVIVLLCSLPLLAQEDLESMAFDDIEIEGFENVWIQSQLTASLTTTQQSDASFKLARPRGGNASFMNYVQKYWMRILDTIVQKYPVELLNRQGYRYLIMTDFTVLVDGHIQINSIYGGKLFGFDAVIAQKMFNDYKLWRPAEINGENTEMRYILKIDLSL